MVPLDASHADGYVLNQTYYNAGCWRRCYQPTQMLAGNQDLTPSDTFSLLCFYKSDERSGRTHETWCGTLAPAMIDASAEIPAANPGTATAAAPAPIRAPQFSTSRASLVRGY
jgi:hypothetical protein